jgi:para-aminobenzoate synthetase component 1
MNREQAIEQINYLGARREAFLFLIDFSMKDNLVFRLRNVDSQQIKFSFNKVKNFSEKWKKKECDFRVVSPKIDEYSVAFEKVMFHINHGDTYLLNLCFRSEIYTKCSLEDMFLMSRAKYRLLYKDKFVFFSPETFVMIKGGKIFSYPMKGTIDASISGAEQKIINDKKEIAEHYTIVDLIRNDLSMVAKDVRVERFRYIDRLHTNKKDILQVSSVVSGVLPSDYRNKLGEILFRMLPAGSVSGAPKQKTISIIESVESYSRNYYTGVAGIFDGEDLDSCVMIRFIEQDKKKMYYRSGGGITFMSKLISEYNEMLDKIYLPISF